MEDNPAVSTIRDGDLVILFAHFAEVVRHLLQLFTKLTLTAVAGEPRVVLARRSPRAARQHGLAMRARCTKRSISDGSRESRGG
jgi:hypothetical protein